MRQVPVTCPAGPDPDNVNGRGTNQGGGCGRSFRQFPDRWGYVYCPYCGLAIKPEEAPT